MPGFTAKCLENTIVADASGTVTFNGLGADVKEFNEHYYEASIESLVVSISHDGGGRNLTVSFTGANRANGVCQVVSTVQPPASAPDFADAAAGGPDFWEIDVHSNLKVHPEPSTGSRAFFSLPGGAVVRNLGCVRNEGRRWCRVPTGTNDGASIGWVAGEFLTEAAGPARMPERMATPKMAPRPHSQDYADALSGGPDFWEVNVHSSLKVHDAPSTAARTVARLPRGTLVQNLGCSFNEGRTWCQIADGDATGWAASEYLVEATGPVRVVSRSDLSEPIVPRTVRLRLTDGKYGGWHDDVLRPGGSVRYLLGASARQTMEVSFHEHGKHIEYRIFEPNGELLLDRTPATLPYQGETDMNGDYVVEVTNPGRYDAHFDMHIGFH
jgi:uncharacterized protein YraI